MLLQKEPALSIIGPTYGVMPYAAIQEKMRPMKPQRRRLPEELHITADLDWKFSFIYKATDQASALHEHELDHVFFGQIEKHHLNVNPAEVGGVKWMEKGCPRTGRYP